MVEDINERVQLDFAVGQRWILEQNYEDLCKIAEAIQNRNSNEAKALAENHAQLFGPIKEERERKSTRNSPEFQASSALKDQNA